MSIVNQLYSQLTFKTGKTEDSELPPGITDEERKLTAKEGPKGVAGEGFQSPERTKRPLH
jgi:hypothetical protein